jgi:ABC-type uncharacterized transport system permease subunit
MAIFFLKIPQKPFVGFARVFFFGSRQRAKFRQKKRKTLIMIFLGLALCFSFVTLIPFSFLFF